MWRRLTLISKSLEDEDDDDGIDERSMMIHGVGENSENHEKEMSAE